MSDRHAHRWQAGLVAAMLLLGLWAWGQLPPGTRVPMHFNARGEVDGWGPPGVALLLLPGLAAGLWALQRLLAALGGGRFVDEAERARQAATTRTVFVAVTALLAWVQCIVVATAVSDWRPSALQFLVPLALVLAVAGLGSFRMLDPGDPALAASSPRAVRTLRWVGVAALVLPLALVLHAALGDGGAALPPLLLAGIGLCLVLVGNVMGKLRPNARVGIRTPWTLAHARVWDQTHRFGGKALVLGGLLLIGLAALPLPVHWHGPVVVATTLGIGATVTLKSWRLWRHWRDEPPAGGDGPRA